MLHLPWTFSVICFGDTFDCFCLLSWFLNAMRMIGFFFLKKNLDSVDWFLFMRGFDELSGEGRDFFFFCVEE